MASRSLNTVMLIGNLTRDPELRYTPQGTAVAQFGLATNRDWVTSNGERKEDVQYHRIIAWSKLAELCSQLLSKGSKVFVQGRIVYRQFEGKDGVQRNITEIVMDNMIVLTPKSVTGAVKDSDKDGIENIQAGPVQVEENAQDDKKEKVESKKTKTKTGNKDKSEDIDDSEIPF